MSLILDALKKSEQERRRDRAPDLQTIHQPTLVRKPQRSYVVPVIIVLVVTNAIALAYWLQQRNAPTVPAFASTVLPATTAQSVAAVAQTKSEPAPLVAPVALSKDATNPEYARITPAQSTPESPPAEAGARIEEVDELPEDIRNNLPAMTFSFHVYSSNPQQRTIIINNRRMREGEEVNSGLQLQQITEDGVILEYAGHRVHISVLSGW